ncbi:MAG: signal peptidase II [Phycisphaerae bacterium]|nr:signal peptidase II [Gemmatimonadaceae bacterium]
MKAVIFWPVLLVLVILDVLTKTLAVTLLAPSGVPREVLGESVRFALVYNPGAAFGLYLGQYSRWIFMVLSAVALVILWRLYRQTKSADTPRTVAITLVVAGAVGNLIDRIRTDLGVVDFIDIGFGTHRWPTFNIADMAVSGGAFLLAWVLWNEDKRAAALAEASAANRTAPLTMPITSAGSGMGSVHNRDAGDQS